MTTYRAAIAIDLGQIVMHIDLEPAPGESVKECFERLSKEGPLFDDTEFRENLHFGVMEQPIHNFEPMLLDYVRRPT